MIELPAILDNISTNYVANSYSANQINCKDLNVINGDIVVFNGDIAADRFIWNNPILNYRRLFLNDQTIPGVFTVIPFNVDGGTLGSYSFPAGFTATESGYYTFTLNAFRPRRVNGDNTTNRAQFFIYRAPSSFNNIVADLGLQPALPIFVNEGSGGGSLVYTAVLNAGDTFEFWYIANPVGVEPDNYRINLELVITKLF